MAEFDLKYFEGEEREGFYVNQLMKRCWAANIEVLKEIERICDRHNIIYFAEAGTLIGAVRHQGFIPWDDDLDIAMSRNDVNRFIKFASKELPKEYKIYTANEGYKEFVVRVVNTNVINLSEEHMKKFHGFPFVAGADIFIYDNLPKEKEEEDVLLELVMSAHSLAYNWNNEEEGSLEEKLELLRQLGELCNYKFNNTESYEIQLLKIAHYLSGLYSKDDCSEVAILYRLKKSDKRRIPKEFIKEIIEVPFENTTIRIPKNYDVMLRKVYKNYTIPKKKKSKHEYPYFKSQQEKLLKVGNEKALELPLYLYEKCERDF